MKSPAENIRTQSTPDNVAYRVPVKADASSDYSRPLQFSPLRPDYWERFEAGIAAQRQTNSQLPEGKSCLVRQKGCDSMNTRQLQQIPWLLWGIVLACLAPWTLFIASHLQALILRAPAGCLMGACVPVALALIVFDLRRKLKARMRHDAILKTLGAGK